MYQRRVFPADLREEWLEVLSVDDCSRRSARASRLLAARPEVVHGSPWWWTDDTGSLLHVAAERGDASLLRVILDAGAPDLPLALDADGQAALHVAVANGHLDAARVLVEVAAAQSGGCTALTLPDKYRMTPFHLACENGDVAMAGVLRSGRRVHVSRHALERTRNQLDRIPLYHSPSCPRGALITLVKTARPDVGVFRT